MGKLIRYISGTVEITTGRKKDLKQFDGVVVRGDTDEEITRNFDYTRVVAKGERDKALKMMAEKRVRLVSFKIKAELGRSNVDK